MSVIVSLCVIRIEICEDQSDIKASSGNVPSFYYSHFSLTTNSDFISVISEESCAMSSRCQFTSNRGRRQVKNITIETYGGTENSESSSLLKNDSKDGNKYKKSSSSADITSAKNDEKGKNNVVDLRLEPITFISGNPFVEVTKGILHLYKDE